MTLTLDDAKAEAVRRDHQRAIEELQSLPAATLRVIQGIELADATAVAVPHGLGRPPLWVKASDPRNPSTSGRIEEVRSSSTDRSKYVTLMASGWGATITVDVAVI